MVIISALRYDAMRLPTNNERINKDEAKTDILRNRS